MAIQLLAEPRGKKQGAPKADLDEAQALAKQLGRPRREGGSVRRDRRGLHEGQPARAGLALGREGRRDPEQRDGPPRAGRPPADDVQAQADRARGRKLLDRALAEYDSILAAQPNLVEAVNNKAWILHSYLDRSQDALALARNLANRVDPINLPGEFYDTLGSIQEKLGQKAEAEESYRQGLSKAPEHPVLNFHMGQLMMGDKAKTRKAVEYLKVAQAQSERLPAELLDKLNLLLLQVPAN